MVRCPECATEVDVDEDEVEEGEILVCPECETEMEVVQIHPVKVNASSDDDDDEEDAMTQVGTTPLTTMTRTRKSPRMGTISRTMTTSKTKRKRYSLLFDSLRHHFLLCSSNLCARGDCLRVLVLRRELCSSPSPRPVSNRPSVAPVLTIS